MAFRLLSDLHLTKIQWVNNDYDLFIAELTEAQRSVCPESHNSPISALNHYPVPPPPWELGLQIRKYQGAGGASEQPNTWTGTFKSLGKDSCLATTDSIVKECRDILVIWPLLRDLIHQLGMLVASRGRDYLGENIFHNLQQIVGWAGGWRGKQTVGKQVTN